MPRRRLTVTGVKPLGAVPSRFAHFSGYGAVEPTTGESFFLERPDLHATHFQMFLNEFSHGDQETLKIILRDNGSGHTATSLVIPPHVGCLLLPPYSPERNPIERLWPEVKAPFAWVVAPALEELAHRVAMSITQYSSAAIRSLTSYPYVVRAVHAVCS